MRRKFNIIFKIFITMFIIISIGGISFGSHLNISNEEYQKRLEEAREIRHSVGMVTSKDIGADANKNDYVEYVFITKNDAKYHKAGCDYMKGIPSKRSLSWAKGNGYGACKYCYQLEEDNSYVWITITIVVSIFMTLLLAFGFKEYYKNKHIDVNNYNIKQ